MGTCRIADTCPLIGESGFLKINFLTIILLCKVNKRKEIMYVLVTYHFPQNIKFNIFMFIDKKFEGHEFHWRNKPQYLQIWDMFICTNCKSELFMK